MAIKKIKIGDEVIITTGKDKGRTGKVLRFCNKQRVIVEGLNLVKKHVRPNPQREEQGGIKEQESGIHISNVAMYNPATKKADRVGIRQLEDGSKVRYFKSNNEVVDV